MLGLSGFDERLAGRWGRLRLEEADGGIEELREVSEEDEGGIFNVLHVVVVIGSGGEELRCFDVDVSGKIDNVIMPYLISLCLIGSTCTYRCSRCSVASWFSERS